jgi:hypothetical protein
MSLAESLIGSAAADDPLDAGPVDGVHAGAISIAAATVAWHAVAKT